MFKVTNKLECPIRCGKIEFLPKETKILDFKPNSDRFHIEKIEETEQKKTEKGGK